MKHLLHGEEAERIKFRKIEESDFNIWIEFFKNPNTNLHWKADLESPYTECQKWYQNQFYRYDNDLGGMNALIHKKSGLLIGHCGLLIQTVDNQQELEIGYSLLPLFWNQGYASEAAQKCRDYAFKNEFSTNLISIISHTNIPSQKVAIKNGMSIQKSTIYKQNEVHIFGIKKSEWLLLNVNL